jgi:hypothetical protein
MNFAGQPPPPPSPPSMSSRTTDGSSSNQKNQAPSSPSELKFSKWQRRIRMNMPYYWQKIVNPPPKLRLLFHATAFIVIQHSTLYYLYGPQQARTWIG